MRRRLLAALFVVLAGASAHADVDVEVALGHNGVWVAEASTPCTIELDNTGDEAVDVTLRLGQAGLLGAGGGTTHVRTVFLGPGASRREMFLIAGPHSGVELRLDVQTSPTTPINHGDERATKGRMAISVRSEINAGSQSRPLEARIVGTVFDEGNVLQYTFEKGGIPSFDPFQGAQETVGVVRVDPNVLRHAPFSLDGIDTLAVFDPDAAFLAQPQDLDAVLDWVALGGHLVISLGRNSARFAAAPLAIHLPARWTGAERRTYSEVLPSPDLLHPEGLTRDGPFTPLSVTALPGARVYLNEDQIAVWVERPFGLGRISVVPIDLASFAPLVQSKKQFRAFGDLLAPMRVPEYDAKDAAMSMPGVENRIKLQDALGTLMRQDAFEAPPFLLVALGLLVYVLVVGPLDWVILKRLKKERLTTVTFAVAVTAFTVLAYGSSFLLFSTGEVVNRVVLADFVSAERDGRELLRVIDLAAYYAPTGDNRTLDYALPAVIAPGSLPSLRDAGGVGRDRPLVLTTRDPVRGTGALEIGFRSQRAVRGTAIGPTGRSLDVSWEAVPGASEPRLANGLAIDVESAWLLTGDRLYAFGAVASGAESAGRVTPIRAGPGKTWAGGPTDLDNSPVRRHVLDLFAYLSCARQHSRSHPSEPFRRLTAQELATLQKSGVDLSRALERGDGLLIAYAERPPIALPGDRDEGHVYVVLRKEIPLR